MVEPLTPNGLLPLGAEEGPAKVHPHNDEVGFDEPWQAELLALANALAHANIFTRVEWSDELGACLQRASAAGEPDTQATYYGAALNALESLLNRSGQVTAQALTERTESWRQAYLATPHGDPVKLSAATRGRDANR